MSEMLPRAFSSLLFMALFFPAWKGSVTNGDGATEWAGGWVGGPMWLEAYQLLFSGRPQTHLH